MFANVAPLSAERGFQTVADPLIPKVAALVFDWGTLAVSRPAVRAHDFSTVADYWTFSAKVFVIESSVEVASFTFTVKDLSPLPYGVPDSTPAGDSQDAGKSPDNIDHV
jgi:hypothetical protein